MLLVMSEQGSEQWELSTLHATSSFDPTSFSSANNAGMTVNVNVAGSVTSENDLIETVRTGILSFQQSGKPITAIQRL
jgi:hypothetical protein